MHNILRPAALAAAIVVSSGFGSVAHADRDRDDKTIDLGPRPFYFVDGWRKAA